MTSFRRRTVEIESSMEDYDAVAPKTMRDYVSILEKVAKVGISGYTDIHITIRGRREELQDLADELQTWSPSGGWTEDAKRLFRALQGEEV